MDAPPNDKPCQATPTASANSAALCHPFGAAPASTQHLSFLSHIPVAGLLSSAPVEVKTTVAGRSVQLRLQPAILVEHEQLWRLDGLTLGDLIAELSMAPGEELEVETYRMERTLLQQSREDASQFESTRELSTTDRESQSVAAVASKTNNWTATDSMDLSLDATIPIEAMPIKAKIDAKSMEQMQKQVVESTDSRTEHAHESTVKAAEKLSTQSKVVLTTSHEVMTSVRQRRTIKNPSTSAALHLFAYEVHKRYTEATWPRRAPPAIAVEVQPLQFDADFVGENPGFLKEAIFDQMLVATLEEALEAAAAVTTRGGTDALTVMENLLFRDTDPELIPFGAPPADALWNTAVFDLAWPRRVPFDKVTLLFLKDHYDRITKGDKIFGSPLPIKKKVSDPSKAGTIESTIKDVYETVKFLWKVSHGEAPPPAQAVYEVVDTKFPGALGGPRPDHDPNNGLEGDSGLWEWVQTPAARLFLEWRYLFWLWRACEVEPKSSAGRFWKANRRQLLERYGRQVQDDFTGMARGILVDFGETTQLARRLDAFLLIADTAFGTVTQGAPSHRAEVALNSILAHLNGHAETYTGRYLGWLERTCGRVALRPALDAAVQYVDWYQSEQWLNVLESSRPAPGRWYDLSEVRRVGTTFFVPLRKNTKEKKNAKFGLLSEVYQTLAAGAKGVAVSTEDVEALLGEAGPAVAPVATGDRGDAGAGSGGASPASKEGQRGDGAGSSVRPGGKAAWASDLGREGDLGRLVGSLGVVVKISNEVRVLADGVHLVAAGSGC